MKRHLPFTAVALALFLAACSEERAAAPDPVPLTEAALSHYCQMYVADHGGPKAQIHLVGLDHPIWFSQVRDAIAYLRLPEETDEVTAVYVNDMDKAPNWSDPGIDNWIAAGDAFFVIGSGMRGGMGAPEAIPFGTRAGADSYAAEHGGTVAGLDDIPDDYVLGPVDIAGLETEAAASERLEQ